MADTMIKAIRPFPKGSMLGAYRKALFPETRLLSRQRQERPVLGKRSLCLHLRDIHDDTSYFYKQKA